MPDLKSWGSQMLPSKAPAPIPPALPSRLWLCPGVFVCWGVACPPSSPAQGSSSKAWHRLSFLQNIHNNNINNNIVDVVGPERCPRVRVGAGSAYEGQGRMLAPAWARRCRSRGCGGGAHRATETTSGRRTKGEAGRRDTQRQTGRGELQILRTQREAQRREWLGNRL